MTCSTIESSIVGREFGPFDHRYDESDTILYALAIGADHSDLPFVYERRGPLAYPTFAFVPLLPAVSAALDALGVDKDALIHESQSLKITGVIPSRGVARSRSTIRSLQDTGANAIVEIACTCTAGEFVAEAVFWILCFKAGGFGSGGASTRPRVVMPDRPADRRIHVATDPRQALLYRLCGDASPIHIDPELATRLGFARPILHGLCTLGAVTRILCTAVYENDPRHISALTARFAGPVFPGDRLELELWRDDHEVRFRARGPDNKLVLTKGRLELTPR